METAKSDITVAVVVRSTLQPGTMSSLMSGITKRLPALRIENSMYRATLALVALSLLTVVALVETAALAEPSHDHVGEASPARAERRREIKSMDIHERPNRPIHVYGNTVRRRSSRG